MTSRNAQRKPKSDGRVLRDHVRVGKTFYPPFLASMSFRDANWRADIIPELIWISLLLSGNTFRRARDLAHALASVIMKVRRDNTIRHWTLTSSYIAVTEEEWRDALNMLIGSSELRDLRCCLAPMVAIYPLCPFRHLFKDGCDHGLEMKDAVESMRSVLQECLFRRERLPMLAQAIHYDVAVATGTTKLVQGVQYHNTETLVTAPDSKEGERTAACIRAFASFISAEHERNPTDWPKLFWNHGREIGPCEPQQKTGTYPNSLPQAFILYEANCFGRYCRRCNELWDIIDDHYPTDLHSPLRSEILLGLVCRMYRVAVQVAGFPPNWTEDMGQVFLRMVVESYIYYSWLSNCGSETDFSSFYEHGLGQQKLYREHFDCYIASHGVNPLDAEELNEGLQFLQNHKMPEFVAVNVGSPLGKSLRALAEECDCREVYSLLYGPTSSVVHGMYDSLDRYYLKVCMNPFHGLHRVPYYWYKSPISFHGLSNCLALVDWAIADVLAHSGRKEDIPAQMPGDRMLDEINDVKAFRRFKRRPEVRDAVSRSEHMIKCQTAEYNG